MPGYDTEIMSPPTMAHRIHDALVDREEAVVEEERAEGRDPEVRRGTDAALEARRQGAEPREEARVRVLEWHGRPGQGQVVRPEQLRELPDHISKRVAHDREGRPKILGGGSTVKVSCPCCPGEAQSFALVYLGDVDEPVRSRIREADYGPRNPGGGLPPYCCDGCWTRWRRDGLFEMSEWIAAHGGPPEIVRHHQVKERMREIEQERYAAGLNYVREDAREQAEREIPPLEGGSG